MATHIQELSPKAKEVLQRNADLRQRDSKFIKVGPGERKILKFNPERIEQVEAEFNGKKSMRFRYTVIEEGSSSNQEKYLEVGKRTSEEIDSFLLEGNTKLKIQRFGSGTDTRYHISCLRPNQHLIFSGLLKSII
jgi:hypothetical protein